MATQQELEDIELLRSLRARASESAAEVVAPEPHVFARGAYSFAYVMAVFVPFVGFLMGLALLARPDDNEGRDAAWIIGVSMVSAVVGAILFAYVARG